MRILRGFFAAAFLLTTPALVRAAETLSVDETARQIDGLLDSETRDAGEIRAAARIDDATFVRRVTLDLVGRPPTPEEVTAFVLDPSRDKRPALVRRLLASREFGRNWARYWRDVILIRSSDPRALIGARPLEDYLAEQFNANTSWQELARAFVTATGDVRENGNAALIVAQQGSAVETTAEISRVFVGIQIQCAQCHDHPTDRWRREQFHELAAFFPRIAVRPVRNGTTRSFQVVSVNRQTRGRGPANRGGTIEHYMPDLEDPTAQGTLMEPRFFVTGSKLETAATDLERREALADWMTSTTNPWFAKALVNRVWAELVGEGFYEPVDDMGPDRQCSAPQTLDLLADEFIRHEYDVKWLYETVAATSAYQRQSRARRTPEQAPFRANCPQRLRADQLYEALAAAIDLPQESRRGDARGGYFNRGGIRGQVALTFGYDPSEPREEIAGSIPQALLLMNSPIVNGPIASRAPYATLTRLLAQEDDDELVVVELYLRCLAREPKSSELKTCLDYRKQVDDRREAFEDILWALVNSTEFLHRN